MAVSPAVEVATVATTTALSQSVSLTTTPLAGDVVVLVAGLTGGGRTISTASGMGATWSEVRADTTLQSTSVWVGTGATASGAITVTFPVAGSGMLRAFLFRGLASTAAVADSVAASTTNLVGPSQSADNGQLVLNVGIILNAGTYPATSVPSAGWTDQAPVVGSATWNTGYRIPTASAAHQRSATGPSAANLRMTQVVFGTAATGSTPTTTATVPVKVASSSKVTALTTTSATVPVKVASSSAAQVVGGPATTSGMVPVKVGSSAAAEVAVAPTALDPWTADLSRRTQLLLVTSGRFDHTPPLALPPAGRTERPLERRSVIVPALQTLAGVVVDTTTGALRVPDDVYAALPRVPADGPEVLGVPHVLVGGRDVTYFRDRITQPISDRQEEPFGDASARIAFPQITSLDAPEGNLDWMVGGARVELVLDRPDGTKTRLWSGHLASDDTGNDSSSATKVWSCVGTLWQASTFGHRVPNLLDPTDIGSLIAKALNGVTSRRYPRLAPVATGIMSRQKGAWSDSELAYCQGLLATAFATPTRQWTVAKKPGTVNAYEVRLKRTGSQWTVTNGAIGVQVSLSRDITTGINVIYGRGIGPDGYAWANTHYPNLRKDDAPAYPYASAGTVMSVGSTDAGTASGTGVSDFQRRARELGYSVAVTGTFTTADQAVTITIQSRYGLEEDGVVGPQTWAATFDVGGNGGDLSGAVRLPLAADPRTQPFLYRADGSVAGPNPAYDKTVLLVEVDLDYGSGVTRAEAIASARDQIQREMNPGLTGRITLTGDPREGSRLLIPAGDRITLVGYEGQDVVLHIAARERGWQGNLPVTLEVDEYARDSLTLTAIRARDKEARRDPARRPGNAVKRSRLEIDQVVPFDGESEGGWIPRMALYPGLWSVIRIPVSELGRVAYLDVRTEGPAAPFALAFFGTPITPAHLKRYVGPDPLALDSPFDAHAEVLEDRFGFIEGWGQKGQPAGYWPGGTALTGRHREGGFEYVSQKPPWVWVAMYASAATFIDGRVLPAPIQ